MDLLALSRALIAADTVSHHGTAAAVNVLRPLYESVGLRVQVQEVVREGVHHQNLLGSYAGVDPGGLLLVTHLDTVDPGPRELWTETGADPFALTRKDDRIYGLGSADTKLDALCKLMAARELQGRPLRRSLQLLGTFEEEVGCKGARHFAQSPELRARFVVCSEPSELTIVRAHKGYAVVRVSFQLPESSPLPGPWVSQVFEGKSAHSSTPHLGVNAIEKAISALGDTPVARLEAGTVSNKVPDRCRVQVPGSGGQQEANARDARPSLKLAAELYAAWRACAKALEPSSHPAFDPATAVVSWGVARVQGGKGELTFDCRLLPGHAPEALLDPFAHQAETLVSRGGGTLHIEVDRASPAMELREPSELLAAARGACRDVSLADAPQAKPTNTEAGVFASAGVEAIVFGPGRSTGNAHTPNEHNLYSQMEKAVEFYRALIARLCLS
jgi:acetylornithine deacetylase/succinyl-diaminopimelate desuccinylase-like protein